MIYQGFVLHWRWSLLLWSSPTGVWLAQSVWHCKLSKGEGTCRQRESAFLHQKFWWSSSNLWNSVLILRLPTIFCSLFGISPRCNPFCWAVLLVTSLWPRPGCLIWWEVKVCDGGRSVILWCTVGDLGWRSLYLKTVDWKCYVIQMHFLSPRLQFWGPSPVMCNREHCGAAIRHFQIYFCFAAFEERDC